MINQSGTTLAWKRSIGCLIAIGACVLTACSDAGSNRRGPLSPEEQVLADAIENRQYNMKDMGAAFKSITDEVRSENPDKNTMFYAAKSIQASARNHSHWFPAGSGPELGIETRAKPEIWQDWEDFNEGVEKFIGESGKLVATMQTTDISGQKAQVKATARTCKACHERFRLPED